MKLIPKLYGEVKVHKLETFGEIRISRVGGKHKGEKQKENIEKTSWLPREEEEGDTIAWLCSYFYQVGHSLF